MPAKRNTNKLSQLYKTIDQKGLSQDAKETLKKLRLATANFNKKEGKEADAFNLFYNRLLAKKPTAIKTTKEYKEMVLEKKREVARKMMEAKKAKQESRQGQGSERDASRPAKPFGWRLKGKHNYRKPTRADISSGKAYYEARINRADTKRTKFPMLERGGYMAKGSYLENDAYSSKKELNKDYKRIIQAPKSENIYEQSDESLVGKFVTIKLPNEVNSFKTKVAREYANVVVGSGKHKGVFSKEYIIKKEYGGYMADGGEMRSYKTFVEEYPDKKIYVRVKFAGADKDVQHYTANEENKKRAISFAKRLAEKNNGTYEGFKTYTYAKGGNVYSSDDAYEAIVLKDGIEVDRVILRGRNKGEAREMYEDVYESKMMKKHGEDITYEIIIAPSKMAHGGSTKFAWQNAQVGDSVLVIAENKMGTIVTTYGRRIHVRFPDGSEKTYFAEDLEFISNDEFAKGGAIKNQYEDRTPENVWNNLSIDQRQHFIYDHADEIEGLKGREVKSAEIRTFYKSNWSDLDEDVKNRFANHVREGQYSDGGEVDKGGMIYALRNEISSGTIANKSGVDTYQEVARVRQEAIDYYLKNGDVPYSLGELDRVLSMSNKMDNSDDMKNRRTLKFSDAVLYKGNMYTFVKRDGDVGFVSNSQGAWGMDGKFLPLRDMLRSDLEQNLTDMYGNKFYIPSYDELIKMPYGFAKGGYVDVEANLIKELQKLQRDLNSQRLRQYNPDDTSEEEMSRQRERASKLARFNEILDLLREIESKKMAKGGSMDDGGNVSTKYAIVDEDTDRIYFRSIDKKLVELKFKEFQEIYPNANLSIVEFTNSYAKGGSMDDGRVFYTESHKLGHE